MKMNITGNHIPKISLLFKEWVFYRRSCLVSNLKRHWRSCYCVAPWGARHTPLAFAPKHTRLGTLSMLLWAFICLPVTSFASFVYSQFYQLKPISFLPLLFKGLTISGKKFAKESKINNNLLLSKILDYWDNIGFTKPKMCVLKK